MHHGQQDILTAIVSGFVHSVLTVRLISGVPLSFSNVLHVAFGKCISIQFNIFLVSGGIFLFFLARTEI